PHSCASASENNRKLSWRIAVSSQVMISSAVSPVLPVVKTDAEVLKSIRNKRAKIAVLGMGHVGLPTALSLAAMGWTVLGADSSESLISQLQSGSVPFYEPGLEELLKEHLGKRFFPVQDLEGAIRKATVLFLCVGTPQKSNGEA